MRNAPGLLLAALVLPLLAVAVAAAFAGDVSVPNRFVSGEPAIAAEVNANFDAVAAAIDDNDARITAIEGALAPAPVRTLRVLPASSPTLSGSRLRTAINNIADSSAANRYRVQLEAGVYDIGGASLTMKPFVDLVGAGVDATTLQASDLVLTLAADSAVRDLRVVAPSGRGVDTLSGANMRIVDVQIQTQSTPVQVGDGARLEMQGVLATSSFGLSVFGGAVANATDCVFLGTFVGSGVSDATLTARNCSFVCTGQATGIQLHNGANATLTWCQIGGGFMGDGLTLVGCYNENMTVIPDQ